MLCTWVPLPDFQKSPILQFWPFLSMFCYKRRHNTRTKWLGYLADYNSSVVIKLLPIPSIKNGVGWVLAPKRHVQVLNLGTCKCDLIWDRVFVDIIKLRWGQTGLGECPHKKREICTQRSGNREEGMWRQRMRRCSYKSRNTQDCRQHQRSEEKGREQVLPRAVRRNQPCWHLDLGLLASWTGMTYTSFVWSHPFVMSATGNYYMGTLRGGDLPQILELLCHSARLRCLLWCLGP